MDQSKTITLLDNESVTVWYHPDKKMIHHVFHTYMHGEAFREALTAGAEAMEKYGADRWLSDDRKNSATPGLDLEWARTVWFELVRKAGWKYWAIVQPEGVIGKLNMKREAEINAQKGVVARLFSDPDEAMAWLESL
jgi:hypothetical protein